MSQTIASSNTQRFSNSSGSSMQSGRSFFHRPDKWSHQPALQIQVLSATQLGQNTMTEIELKALVHLQSSVTIISIDQLCQITAQIKTRVLHLLLARYKNRNYIIDVLSRGFSVYYSGPTFNRLSHNHNSATYNPLVLSALSDKKIKCCRIVEPFNIILFSNAIISHFGLIPKKVAGQFRLIRDLFFSKDNSVNDGIPYNLRTVHNESLDDSIHFF